MIIVGVLKKTLWVFFVGVVFFSISDSAKAAYGNLPAFLVSPTAYTNGSLQYVNISDTVPAPGNPFGAYLPYSDTKVYSTTKQPGATRWFQVKPNNFSADNDCSGYRIRYYIYAVNQNTESIDYSIAPASGYLWPTSTPASTNICAGALQNNLPLPDDYLTPSNKPDHQGLYVARLRLSIESIASTGSRHTSYLQIVAPSSPDTRIDYTADGISTIYPAYESTQPYKTLAWKFRPSCDGTDAYKHIQWQDDDAPPPTYTSGNQTQPLSVDLRTYNQQGALVEPPIDIRGYLSGSSGYSSVPPPHGAWNPNYKYEIVFSNVEFGNGIGVKLPFDSGDFDLPCPREFNTKGSTQVTLNDPENPTSITATGNIQDDGGETAAPIISASLTVTRNGTPVGTATNVAGSPWGWAGNLNVPSNTFIAAGGVRSLGWQVGDEVCSRLTWTYAKGSVIPGTLDIRRHDVDTRTVTSDPAQCKRITNKPYVSAYNNDIAAGGGGLGQPCSSTAADIRANTKNAGSGTQLAAYATGSISGFKSVFLKDIGSPITPNGLTFGNTPGLGNYSQVDCATNFFDVDQYEDGDSRKIMSNVSSLGFVGLVSGNQTVVTPPPTAKLNLTGGSFNGKYSIFVDGDVFIANNIAYSTTSWARIADIPFFNLVVRGNIYISQDVTQLDGRYIAQPRDATNGGYIFTCAYKDAAPVPAASRTQAVPTDPGSGLWANCRNRLTINGQFVAKSVRFLRVLDTISNGQAGETPQNAARQPRAAEIFNFSPEMYLAQPATRAKSSATSGEYQTITTLPPIL